MILKLDANQVLLNKLYVPIIRNGKPSIVKSKEAKEFTKYVQMVALSKMPKLIKGDVSFHMDICISKRRNYDIDASLKLLFDSLNNIAYKDDSQIVELIVRKHINQDKDELVIKIEEME